jgi:hypothetical protein
VWVADRSRRNADRQNDGGVNHTEVRESRPAESIHVEHYRANRIHRRECIQDFRAESWQGLNGLKPDLVFTITELLVSVSVDSRLILGTAVILDLRMAKRGVNRAQLVSHALTVFLPLRSLLRLSHFGDHAQTRYLG